MALTKPQTQAFILDILNLNPNDTGFVELSDSAFVLMDGNDTLTTDGSLQVGSRFIQFDSSQPNFFPRVQIAVSYANTISGGYSGSGTLRFFYPGGQTPLYTTQDGNWSFQPPPV